MAKSSFKKRTHAVREDTPSVGRNNNNKQNKKKQKSKAKDDEPEFSVDPAEFDRFAGSSEEEDDENVDQDPNDVDEDREEDEDEVVPMKKLDNPEEMDDADSNEHDNGSSDDNNDDNDRDGESEPQTSTSKPRTTRNEHDTNDTGGANAHDGSSSSEDEDSPDEEIQPRSMGMANAMSRILGMGVVPQHHSTRKDGTTSAGTKPQPQQPIVLSKTITPLQRQAQKDKQEYQEMLKRRKLNKEQKELTALHIPLLLTTTKKYQKDDTDDDKHHQSHDSVAVELDRERLHRRVATRGVVALFNAIAQHQQQQQKQQQHKEGTTSSAATIGSQDPGNRSAVGTAHNKHAFLDQIKATAVAQGTTSTGTAPQPHSNPPLIVTATASTNKSSKPQWNALQDDFMLNPKKNWDQDDDDDEDDDDEP